MRLWLLLKSIHALENNKLKGMEKSSSQSFWCQRLLVGVYMILTS